MNMDRFKINSQKDKSEPGVQRDIVCRYHAKPFYDRNKRRLEDHIRNDKEQAEKQTDSGSFEEEDTQNTRDGNAVQDTEKNKIFGHIIIGHRGDDEGPTPDPEKSLFDMTPLDPFFMDQRKAHARAYQEERCDEPGKILPQEMADEWDIDNPEKMQIIGKVKDDHQHDTQPPQAIEHHEACFIFHRCNHPIQYPVSLLSFLPLHESMRQNGTSYV